MSIKAADISNYTDTLEQGEIDCLKAAGVQHVTVRASLDDGLPSMDIAKQQLAALKDAGISTSLYAWTYSDWEARRTVQDTVATFGKLATTDLIWLDVEPYRLNNPRLPSLAWLRDAVDEVKRQGYRPGIYTGKWVWNEPAYPYNGSTAFADLPLWMATFDQTPDLQGGGLPFGGWQTAAIEQYAGSGQQQTCGLFVDLDVIDEALLGATPPPPPTIDLTSDEFRYGLVKRIVAGEWQSVANDLAALGIRAA